MKVLLDSLESFLFQFTKLKLDSVGCDFNFVLLISKLKPLI